MECVVFNHLFKVSLGESKAVIITQVHILENDVILQIVLAFSNAGSYI